MYKLIILPPAVRYLKKLKEKPLKAAFQKAVDEILADPYIGEPKIGYAYNSVYRIRFFTRKQFHLRTCKISSNCHKQGNGNLFEGG